MKRPSKRTSRIKNPWTHVASPIFLSSEIHEPPVPSLATVTLITERGKQHGNWHDQADTDQQLKYALRKSYNARHGNLSVTQIEALEMIMVKLSRILSGDPSHADHWDDLQGYAELGKSGHPK